MKPAIFVIHGLDHGRAALEATSGRDVVLLSPPGAAGHHGIGWWLALLRALRAEFPEARMVAALDCADCPGWALAALGQGVESIILAGDGPAQKAVREAAEQKGAWGEGRWGNDALDLLGAPDPGRSCREWVQRLCGSNPLDKGDPARA